MNTDKNVTSAAITGELRRVLAEATSEYEDPSVRKKKIKTLKGPLAPLADFMKETSRREVLLQRCLELPAGDPLRAAAQEVVASGIAWTPWVSIAAAPQPARRTGNVVLSAKSAVAYALDVAPRVAIWSLESGVHEGDLPLPCGKKAYADCLVELPDGTLRVITTDGLVCEREPGAKKFVKVLELKQRRQTTVRPDLRYAVTQVDTSGEEEAEKTLRFIVHDLEKRTECEIGVPAVRGESSSVWVGGLVAVSVMTDWDKDEYALAVIDPASAAFTMIDLAGELSNLRMGPHAGTVLGDIESDTFEIHLTTHATRPVPSSEEEEEEGRPPRRAADGRTYQPRHGGGEGVLRGKMGDEITRYGFYPFRNDALWDDARGQLVLWGNDTDGNDAPVTIIAPYNPQRASGTPQIVPEVLEWARRGTVLTYALADEDASGAWTFEVREATPGLTLRVRAGEELVAENATFTKKGIETAKRSVTLSQGGADVDLAAPQTASLPPILISRGALKKLATGENVAWTVWGKKQTLGASGRGVETVCVDGTTRAVATRRATGEGISLTVLDHDQWPLVLAFVKDECTVRLQSIELPKARA